MTDLSDKEIEQLLAGVNKAVGEYDGSATLPGMEKRATIRAAARKLFLAMSTPEDQVWTQVFNMTELVGRRTCLKLGVFKAIPLEGSASAVEIAKATNSTPSLIVASGFIEQTDSGDYKHTRFSKSSVDTTVPGPGTFFQAMYDVYLKTTLTLDEWIEKMSTSGHYSEPSSNFHNPFTSYYGDDGQSAWDVMASVPDVMKTFQISLLAMDQMIPPLGPFYDFSQFKATSDDPDRIQLVDVGGGYGKVVTDIVKGTPELDPKKCVLQDVERVLGIADAAKALGIQTMVIDFHKEQPIKGAKAYYMRFISHDYSDADIINILSHVAKSMAPDSKMLIADCVIPDRLEEATHMAGVLDQLMFCIGGKERTEVGFKSILDPCGLELVGLNRIPGSTAAIVEAKLKA